MCVCVCARWLKPPEVVDLVEDEDDAAMPKPKAADKKRKKEEEYDAAEYVQRSRHNKQPGANKCVVNTKVSKK